jgi:hypothetical protein
MNNQSMPQQRLSNQHLAGNPLKTAEAIVSHLTAVQAQDYFGAKWAVGQRVQDANEETIKQAFNDGRILRTHMMRPTWHFVTPEAIRWIQALTAPRVHIVNGYMYRKLELNDAIFAQTNDIIAKAVEGSQYKTRTELGQILEQNGIPAKGMRLGYILMQAELNALICSGPRIGKQFSYALLDERAPNAKTLPLDEALAELTRRYFTGHGPAELEDFTFWSGLTKTQARKGLALNDANLIKEMIDGHTFWLAPNSPLTNLPSPTAHLLPNYDEYLISYRNSGPFMEPAHGDYIEKQNPLFAHFLFLDGRLLGTWRRDFEKDTLILTLRRFTTLSDEQETAVHTAATTFARFLNLNAELRSAPLP